MLLLEQIALQHLCFGHGVSWTHASEKGGELWIVDDSEGYAGREQGPGKIIVEHALRHGVGRCKVGAIAVRELR